MSLFKATVDTGKGTLLGPMTSLCLRILNKSTTSYHTTGGSKDAAASWAMAHLSGWACAGEVKSEDYTPIKAELCAAECLTRALAEVAEDEDLSGLTLNIAIDCKPALRLITRRKLPRERWRHVVRIQAAARKIREAGARLAWHWVPSHNKKKKSFVPSYDEESLRRSNGLADTAASQVLKKMLAEKEHLAYLKARKAADAWFEKAILRTAEYARLHVEDAADKRISVENLEQPLADEQLETDDPTLDMFQEQVADFMEMRHVQDEEDSLDSGNGLSRSTALRQGRLRVVQPDADTTYSLYHTTGIHLG
eukprot:TRINITY_DN20268_c0_g2_i2.p1 TRINITY_DN20268_c0_g2~~TRINITY_DN20268_c0_g2_i2.p1  ORF type:complete len:309 (-),score=49.38 TRINITY_DN20268_c0_g2_i2:2286-3212(-)